MDKYNVAFEVGCGGSFSVVIVDTPDVSKNLINHGSKYHVSSTFVIENQYIPNIRYIYIVIVGQGVYVYNYAHC